MNQYCIGNTETEMQQQNPEEVILEVILDNVIRQTISQIDYIKCHFNLNPTHILINPVTLAIVRHTCRLQPMYSTSASRYQESYEDRLVFFCGLVVIKAPEIPENQVIVVLPINELI